MLPPTSDIGPGGGSRGGKGFRVHGKPDRKRCVPDQPQTPSLIQRRMALSRGLIFPIVTIAASLFNLIFQILPLVETGDSDAWRWSGVALWAILLVAGVVLLVRARRAITAFERENGRDAGKQKLVGRP